MCLKELMGNIYKHISMLWVALSTLGEYCKLGMNENMKNVREKKCKYRFLLSHKWTQNYSDSRLLKVYTSGGKKSVAISHWLKCYWAKKELFFFLRSSNVISTSIPERRYVSSCCGKQCGF